jgi:hypothetical protein
MPLNFPTSPALNELYTFNSKTWKWDGSGWVSYNVGLIGPIGITGPTGPIGPTGPAGSGASPTNYVTFLNGFTGGITLSAGNGIDISNVTNTVTITNQLYTLIDGGDY